MLGATAQAYSLTFDLAWKLMKDVAIEEYGVADFVTGSPRDTLRAAYRLEIISDDRWIKMLQVRNTLIHDYNGTVANNYFLTITTDYVVLFEELESKITSLDNSIERLKSK